MKRPYDASFCFILCKNDSLRNTIRKVRSLWYTIKQDPHWQRQSHVIPTGIIKVPEIVLLRIDTLTGNGRVPTQCILMIFCKDPLNNSVPLGFNQRLPYVTRDSQKGPINDNQFRYRQCHQSGHRKLKHFTIHRILSFNQKVKIIYIMKKPFLTTNSQDGDGNSRKDTP